MSSKMLAGLIAGGFGVALYVALIVSVSFSSLLAGCMTLALLLGLGVLAGALSASWLDLPDYGQQTSAGAFSGLVAAGITELCDLAFRLVMVAIGKPNPMNVISNLLVSRLPTDTEVAFILLLVIVNLLLYLIYLLVVVGISGLTAGLAGQAKSAEARTALIAAQEAEAFPNMPADPEQELLDPALWPYQRPEYSPFISDAPPPPPLPPWQRRRLEQEGGLADEQDQMWSDSAQGVIQSERVIKDTPQRQNQRGSRLDVPSNAKPVYRLRLPAYGQRPKPRGGGQ